MSIICGYYQLIVCSHILAAKKEVSNAETEKKQAHMK